MIFAYRSSEINLIKGGKEMLRAKINPHRVDREL